MILIPFAARLRLFLLFAGALASAPVLWGYTQSGSNYTTDGSQADVSAALGAAAAGSIINVPAGTFTWGAGGSPIYIPNAVSLVGAGPANTIINLDPGAPGGVSGTLQFFAAITVKGFTINGAGNATPFSTNSSGWRITNVVYNAGTDTSYFCFISQGTGLIDNCTITGGGGSDELIFATGSANSWQTPDSLGGANNVYVEDCTFNGQGYLCDANANARMVVRFCTITGPMKIDAHGFASNTPRGVREIEIYNNTWTISGGPFPEIELRGGTGMVFNNNSNATTTYGLPWYFLTDYGYQGEWPNFGVGISSATAGSSTIITTTTPHGLQSNWGPIGVTVSSTTPAISGDYTVQVINANAFSIPVNVTSAGTGGGTAVYQTPVNYPINDQIGVGQDPKVGGSAPLYSWNNIQNGAPWQRVFKSPSAGAETLYASQAGNGATFAETDLIKADRDVFLDLTVTGAFDGSTGVGTGTFAQMNLIRPTKTGVGFWVTDQGTWNNKAGGTNGELYVWNGTAWVLKYVPYTYPNPLRGPIAPTNLIISTP